MWRHVELVRTDVSEESVAFIIRVKIKNGVFWVVTSWGSC
jgi:hypothetical protein